MSASADLIEWVVLKWAPPEAGARPNDGNSSTLNGRVGVVSDNIRAASHEVGSHLPAVQRNRSTPRLTGRSHVLCCNQPDKSWSVPQGIEQGDSRLAAEDRRPVQGDLGDVQQ